MAFKAPDKQIIRLLGLFLKESEQEKRKALASAMRDRLAKLYDDEVKKTVSGWGYYVCAIALTRLFGDTNNLSDRIRVFWKFRKCYARMLRYI